MRQIRKHAGWAIRVLAIVFCIFIFLAAWENRGITIVQWRYWKAGEISFSEFVDNVSSGILANMPDKNDYINLNGLYARLTGQITCNDVVRLNDGMLTIMDETVEKLDMEPRAESISELSAYLEEKEIEFLYVQAPDKVNQEKELLPDGITNYTNENADELLACLEEAGVSTLDLRPYTSATAELSEMYFYRTDHHWNALGAFVGFQKITEYIKEIFPKTEINEEILSLDQWELHTKEDWSLGSRGKRVGIYFGGVDDLIWLTPKFETEMSCSIPYRNDYFKQNGFYKGTFEYANLWEKYYDSDEPDYFNTTTYDIFGRGDYALVQLRNAEAASDRKLLIIKDSFVLPVQAFLATEFQEIDVIDLRYYDTVGSLADYIEDSQPDMVVMMMYPGSFSTGSLFSYGQEEVSGEEEGEALTILSEASVLIDQTEAETSYGVLLENLEPGAVYELTFDGAVLLQGESDCITAALYGEATTDGEETISQLRYFDVEYYNENGGYRWHFTVPEATEGLSLVIWPGQQAEDDEEAEENKEKILELYEVELTKN
ncbi:MAG: hypothetical protein LUE31_09735 [Lachnospiraceae bacterium]|nr:hypothetical protein [Lachnospiraceae bacterium]